MTTIETFDVTMTAKFLFTSEATVLQLADSGALPGAKIGKSWVFDSRLVHEYLLSQIHLQTMERKIKFDSKINLNSARTSTALGEMKQKQSKRYPDLPEPPSNFIN